MTSDNLIRINLNKVIHILEIGITISVFRPRPNSMWFWAGLKNRNILRSFEFGDSILILFWQVILKIIWSNVQEIIEILSQLVTSSNQVSLKIFKIFDSSKILIR